MSEKEQCIQMIESLTESELVHLKGIIRCYLDAMLERRRAEAFESEKRSKYTESTAKTVGDK